MTIAEKLKNYRKNIWSFPKGPGVYILIGIIGGFIGTDWNKRSQTLFYQEDINSDGIADVVEISEEPFIFPRYINIKLGQKDGQKIKLIPYEDIVKARKDSLETEISIEKKQIDKNIEKIIVGGSQ